MPELDEKREEAIVESVLFTMGKSVELRQLAAALGTDTEPLCARKRRSDDYRAVMRQKSGACRSRSWRTVGRWRPARNIMRI